MKTLQDCLTINVTNLGTLLDEEMEASLQKALSSLDFKLWLQKWGISDYPQLREKGHTSHEALCSMSADDAKEVCLC